MLTIVHTVNAEAGSLKAFDEIANLVFESELASLKIRPVAWRFTIATPCIKVPGGPG